MEPILFLLYTGYHGEEEHFEHVTNGKTRDIKVGIRLWKKKKGKLHIPFTISNKCKKFVSLVTLILPIKFVITPRRELL